MKKRSTKKCPICGRILSKKAWIHDYGSMIVVVCGECGFAPQEKLIGVQ
jgi:hypothetical protein